MLKKNKEIRMNEIKSKERVSCPGGGLCSQSDSCTSLTCKFDLWEICSFVLWLIYS